MSARLVVYVAPDGTTHADRPDGLDYTLCGEALEGDDVLPELSDGCGKINCAKCIAIIVHCKSIRPTQTEAA